MLHAKEELSFKAGENARLLEQMKSVRGDWHEAKLELAKLHQFESVQLDLKTLKQQLATTREQHQAVLEQLNFHKLKAASSEELLNDSQRRRREGEAELENLKGKLECTSSEAGKWKTEFSRISTELRNLKTEHDFVDSEARKVKKERDLLAGEVKDLKARCQDLGNENDRAKQESEQALASKKLLEQEMEHMAAEVKKLRAECTRANSDTSKMKVGVDHVSGELSKLKLERDLMVENVRSHERLLENKRSEVKRIHEDHAQDMSKVSRSLTSNLTVVQQ